PLLVRGRLGDETPSRLAADGISTERLAPIAAIYRLTPDEIALVSSTNDKQHNSHLRYQQYLSGLPVIGAELLLHVDRNGHIYLVSCSARGRVDIEGSVPAVNETDAQSRAVGTNPNQRSIRSLGLAFYQIEFEQRLVWGFELADGNNVEEAIVRVY